MIFNYRKSLFKIVLGQNFFNCRLVFKNCPAYFRTNLIAPNSAKKTFCLQLNEIENVKEIQLSESRNYTLDQLQGNHKADHSVKFSLHIKHKSLVFPEQK